MQPKQGSSRYLLRFDDLCPTMNWRVWSEVETELIQRNLKPILAVVPDNQDPTLKIEPAAENFWERVRGWQARGWTIALHGYQHRYVTYHRGIVTPRKKSEFAGLPVAGQDEKLRRGMEIFKRQGIQCQLWVAPSNSFDATTVSLLPRFGIRIICDGNFRYPFKCRRNLFWIPQQLFHFRPAPKGVWTVCYHHNGWSRADLRQFRCDLDDYGPQVTGVQEVVNQWAGRTSQWSVFLCTSPQLSSLLIRFQLKLVSWWQAAHTPLEVKAVSHFQTR